MTVHPVPAEWARRAYVDAAGYAEKYRRSIAEPEAFWREESARIARLSEPVKPGDVVPEIFLDNGDTIHGAVVVAVQPTSVSFRVGARLYNIPTEQLPAEVRARLPGLNITGHTYSDNPTLRTLMIDGRMFVEGQAVQPGLRVERIDPHRAVFNHQGTRFAVDY